MVVLNGLVEKSDANPRAKKKFNLSLPVMLKDELDEYSKRYGSKRKWLPLTAAVAMFLRTSEEARRRVIEEMIVADGSSGYDDIVAAIEEMAATGEGSESKAESVVPDKENPKRERLRAAGNANARRQTRKPVA